MDSPMAGVLENLKVFGLSGFREKTEAFRFARDKQLNFADRDRVYWAETGRHLPRPQERTMRKLPKAPKHKREQLHLSKRQFNALLDL